MFRSQWEYKSKVFKYSLAGELKLVYCSVKGSWLIYESDESHKDKVFLKYETQHVC